MQKKRGRALVVLRKVLTCAICSIGLVALFSVHVPAFPSSKVPKLSDPFKLPMVITDPPPNFHSFFLFFFFIIIIIIIFFFWLGLFFFFIKKKINWKAVWKVYEMKLWKYPIYELFYDLSSNTFNFNFRKWNKIVTFSPVIHFFFLKKMLPIYLSKIFIILHNINGTKKECFFFFPILFNWF